MQGEVICIGDVEYGYEVEAVKSCGVLLAVHRVDDVHLFEHMFCEFMERWREIFLVIFCTQSTAVPKNIRYINGYFRTETELQNTSNFEEATASISAVAAAVFSRSIPSSDIV